MGCEILCKLILCIVKPAETNESRGETEKRLWSIQHKLNLHKLNASYKIV